RAPGVGLVLGGLRAGDAPHDAAVRGRYLPETVAETVADEIVPAVRRRRVAAFEARHIQPVARARQGYVQQPVALLRLGPANRRLGLLHGCKVARTFDRPDEGQRRVPAIELEQTARRRPAGPTRTRTAARDRPAPASASGSRWGP